MTDTPDPENFKTRLFYKGETLVKEGENGADVFLIVRGKVEVRKGKHSDLSYVFGVKGPGEIIGEMAAFDDCPHVATVVALTETVVTVMSRAEFQRRLGAMDPIMRGAIVAVVRRAREMAHLLSDNLEPIRLTPKRR
jgi:CRP/FNR family transcriptional regulator